MQLHSVWYANEIRSMEEIRGSTSIAFSDAENEAADAFIAKMSTDRFDPSPYKDEYRARLLAAIDAKTAGKEVSAAEAAPKTVILDLLAALKQSVAEAKTAAPSAPAPAQSGQVKAKGPRKAEPRDEEKPAKKKGGSK